MQQMAFGFGGSQGRESDKLLVEEKPTICVNNDSNNSYDDFISCCKSSETTSLCCSPVDKILFFLRQRGCILSESRYETLNGQGAWWKAYGSLGDKKIAIDNFYAHTMDNFNRIRVILLSLS